MDMDFIRHRLLNEAQSNEMMLMTILTDHLERDSRPQCKEKYRDIPVTDTGRKQCFTEPCRGGQWQDREGPPKNLY